MLWMEFGMLGCAGLLTASPAVEMPPHFRAELMILCWISDPLGRVLLMALDALSDVAGQLMEGLFLKLQICSLRNLKYWQTSWALHRCSYTSKNHSGVTKMMFL